jgi:cysteinyl-tRNA synthetase
MKIRLHNTLSHRVEDFSAIEPPRISMYNCGPTVYDFAHIGNFRAFVFADVLRRFLELAGYQVDQVMNLTDVGHMTDDSNADGGGKDKMIVAGERIKEAKKQGKADVANPDDPYQVAQYYIDAFIADAKSLRLKIADEYPARMPRATQHVGKMMKIILHLIENQHAYVAADGAVYYDVQSFPEYGRLSGNTLDKLRTGAGGRVSDGHQAVKKHPADFLLWKPDPSHIMKWESPWGMGYPGWHIECSAMAVEMLGREVIDIHTGGEDNIFPHHECEIAQSCGYSGKPSFAKYWMHTRFLLVDGEKMSKSKGNFYTLRDLTEGRASGRAIDPAVVRFELLKAHYRSNMNFTLKGLEDSASAVRRFRDAAATWGAAQTGEATVDLSHPVLAEFSAALADDLNMAGALGVVFTWLSDAKPGAESLAVLRKIDGVLGVLATAGTAAAPGDADAAAKCAALDAARAAKDFAAADRLRKELMDAGYEVMTNKQTGTTARKKLA